MTFTEVVTEVCERLNLTSPEAIARVGGFVNQRHRRIQTAVYLAQTRRTAVSANTTSGSHTLVPSGIIKVFTVTDQVNNWVLGERTLNELRQMSPNDQAVSRPNLYAVTDYGPQSVTLYLYPEPTSVSALLVDGLALGSELTGSQMPGFPEDFHDTLVYGALADEYYHRDKFQQAKMQEAIYSERLSDLRMFIAKSAYLSKVQANQASWPWSRAYVGLVP